MVDPVVESNDFSFGIRHVKAVCVAVGMESSNEAVRKKLVAGNFNSSELNVVTQSAYVIHAFI